MPYTCKPDADDVILTVWQERDRAHVSLSLREGEDGIGDTVVEWRDEDCAQAFEDGYLKGRMRDGDPTLLSSALKYASDHGIQVLSSYSTEVVRNVDALAEGIVADYDRIQGATADDGDDEEDRREMLVEKVVDEALAAPGLRKVSSARLDDIRDHLTNSLDEALAAREAATPAP